MDILFITSNRIGDAMLTTGVLGHLLDRYGEATVTVVCGPLAASLFAAAPRVRVLPMQKQPWSRHWLALWRHCFGTRWRLVVDLRKSPLAWLLRAKERKVLGRRHPALHVVEECAALIGAIPPPAPRLWLDRERLEQAARMVPEGPPVLAIGPAANWKGKQWRGERFAELALHLTGPDGSLPGARVAVLAAPHERGQAAPLVAAVPPDRLIDLVGRTDPALAGACLQRCALYIGNDTGLTHIAAAAGVPTLALFGPGIPERYAPWGPRTAVVQTPLSREELVATPGYHHRTTDTLMDSLTVEAVAAAAARLLERTRRRDGDGT